MKTLIISLVLGLATSMNARADLFMASKILQVGVSEARDVATGRTFALIALSYLDYSSGQLRNIYLSGDVSSRVFDRCDNILTTSQGQSNKAFHVYTRSAASFTSTDSRYITHYLIQNCGLGEIVSSAPAPSPYPSTGSTTGGSTGSTSGGGY